MELPQKFHECKRPEENWDIHYTTVYFVDLDLAYKDGENQEEVTQGDFLLAIYEAKHHIVADFPKGASIHNYFHGVHKITGLEANNVVREFIAENENYWRPLIRIAVAITLLVSLLFLLAFFVIQTLTVCNTFFS